MEEFALSRLGLKPWEYEVLTLRQYYLMSEGYWLKEEMEWDKIRFQCAWHANIRPGIKKIHMVKPEHIKQLPHLDKGTTRQRKPARKPPKMTPELEQEIYRKFNIPYTK